MNTIAEEISLETIGRIKERALDMGLSADAYVRSILPAENTDRENTTWEEFASDMEEFGEDLTWTGSFNGSYSREDIYFDHD